MEETVVRKKMQVLSKGGKSIGLREVGITECSIYINIGGNAYLGRFITEEEYQLRNEGA
ncbi:hypothetical protein LCGC14_2753720 [marine sediment metagenome]|uniref:Uncharacterized protein n=1 Tax=marine sediment metagenome TaxID=412755 RepID=A0A0F8ZN51_9ZZZZ